MREHPIPQDITSYRFHIIGNMTLKQFGQLALGVILAVVTYATNLPALIKVPFIILFVILGIVAAFVPIAERPLDHWIVTFFKVLYKPTLYFWQKSGTIPPAFTYVSKTTQVFEPELDLNPARRERIKEYISSVSYIETPSDSLEPAEQTRLQSIIQAFESVQVSTTTIQQGSEKPNLDVRVRPMRVAEETLQYLPINEINVNIDHQSKNDVYYDTIPQYTTHADPNKQILTTDQVAQQIEIPKAENMHVDSKTLLAEEKNLQAQNFLDEERSYTQQTQTTQTQPTDQILNTQYNLNLPFPKIPTIPNKPVGMVLSTNNELITGALVEIKTIQGTIARAIKTNALGQFFVTTPLEAGSYIITVSKPGYTFSIQELAITDQIVSPIEIRGTRIN